MGKKGKRLGFGTSFPCHEKAHVRDSTVFDEYCVAVDSGNYNNVKWGFDAQARDGNFGGIQHRTKKVVQALRAVVLALVRMSENREKGYNDLM